MSNIKIDGQIDLVKSIEAYSKDVQNKVNDLAVDLGQEGLKTLKDTSPKRTGKYAKSWKIKKQVTSSFVNVILYNTKSGLPHLLEKKHKVWNKPEVQTKAQVHIEPVEKDLNERFEKGIEEILNK